MTRKALRGPVAVGLEETPTWHEDDAGKGFETQVLLMEKSVAAAPVRPKLVTVIAEAVMLFKMVNCGSDDLPTSVAGKVRVVGLVCSE